MKTPRRRKVTSRRLPALKTYTNVARELLEHAERIFELSDGLDTAVRDVIADGLANIVHSAFDTQSIAANIPNEGSHGYIVSNTEEWFRDRGFAEWFCHGAGQLFTTSRPRILSERIFKVRRVSAKRKRS